MKLLKFILAISIGLATIQQRASADVTVHLSGSTAFRAATVIAILNRMGSATAIYSDDSTTITGSSFCTIKGSWPSVTGTTTVECAWSGSVGGIQTVTGHASPQPTFYPTGHNAGGTAVSFTSVTVNSTVANGGTAFNIAQSNSHSDGTAPTQPELCMADNYQVSSIYTSPALVDNIVGIVPFAWVVGANAPAGLTNVGPNVVKAIYNVQGYLSGAVFTGNQADRADGGGTDGTMIYGIGRDNLSGTRVQSFAEPGIGIFSSVAQYTPSAADTGVAITNNTVTQITLDDRINNVVGAADAGNGGENSGGSLADEIRYTTTAVVDQVNGWPARNIAFLTYLGEPDSYRAVAGFGSKVTGTNAINARYLTYNGVAGFQGSFFNDVVSTTSGNTTLSAAGSANPASAFVGVVAGQAVKGVDIAPDTVVVSVNTVANPNTIVMSAAATGTSTTQSATVANLVASTIRNGTYTMWGYEHIMWQQSVVGTTGDVFQVASQLKTQIASGGYINGAVNTNNHGDYFVAGLANDSAMLVKRSSDGGPVVTTY